MDTIKQYHDQYNGGKRERVRAKSKLARERILNYMNITKNIGWALLVILAIDALGFIAWIASGQYPVDDFYIGTITAHVLRFIIQ